ncbi:interferon-inducible GTPase 1-like [Perognathus longimembris pacificus]|uniref:interferon-inducible GTPase 1-like n=1 Tax=Perognathus longimembris pacificus TaxID=214514 RepID=UPI002019A615|nr:interferon-inducible GTPase 1-like [Perognathus longimembris pacificus]
MGQFFSETPDDTEPREVQSLDSSFDSYFKNFKMETKILSPDAICSIKDYLLKGDMQRANAVITAMLKDIDNAPLNIAVTGGSGAGKSSFINALRGIGHEEEEAAPTGVQDTTMERKKYTYANAPNVTLWDLPGIGTPNFQPKDYLEKVKFKEYDFFFIVSATRFGYNDIELAKAIKFMKKDFYFVRSKVDFLLMNEQRYRPKSFEREKVLQEIRNYCVKTFEQNGVEVPEIFLISNHDLADYDFPILTDTLLKNLPAQKRQVFLNSLPNITDATIEMKRETEMQQIWLEAFKGGAWATLPVVGILRDDEKALEERLNRYRTCFGVDDESLQSFADNLKVPVERLMTIIQSPHLLKTTEEEQLGDKLWRYLEITCSTSGGPLASWLYFRKYYYLLLHFLDIVANDAKVLLKETYSMAGI